MSENSMKPQPTSLRLDPDVLESLDAYCASTRRNRNSAVNFLLATALAEPEATEVPQESTTHYRDEVAR